MNLPRLGSLRRARILGLGGYFESVRIGNILRKETAGGLLLVGAAITAIIWANSPVAQYYFELRDYHVGYEPWGLNLSLGEWSSEGLLAIFFFLVGLELKRELVAGDLRKFSTAIVPVSSAFGGVLAPAAIYALVNWGDPALLRGWAIPTATDIAFALAVLAIIGSRLPNQVRIFLLTLAVVDDFIAITIIAVFYTNDVELLPLCLVVIPLTVFGFIAQRYRKFFRLKPSAAWLILLPIALLVWGLVYASGVHATISGALLGFTIPVLRSRAGKEFEPGPGLAQVLEHRLRPLSTGIAVPVFAFFMAGVYIGGVNGFVGALSQPVTIGVSAALLLGKPIGIVGTTWVLTKATRAKLDPAVKWIDLIGVSILAGIGFTVSLLVAALSFGIDSLNYDDAKIAILVASVAATLLASAILHPRHRHYRRLEWQVRTIDDDVSPPDVNL